MANRYWVGGTGTWSNSNFTNWSSTSGGSGGSSPPESADDVFLDANSGGGTVTVASGLINCKSITCSGFTGTFASASGTSQLTVSNGVTLGTTMAAFTFAGKFTLGGSGTFTSNGRTVGAAIDISGVAPLLGDDLTCTGIITVRSGTFNLNNKNLTCDTLATATVNAKTITLGSGTVTITGLKFGCTGVSTDTGTVTYTATTGTIRFTNTTGSTANFYPYISSLTAGTFGNIWFDRGASTGTNVIKSVGAPADPLTVGPTFGEIKDNGTAAHTLQLPASNNTTCTSFTVQGTAGNLISLRSTTAANVTTYLTKTSGTVTTDYLDIADSQARGGATWSAGSHSTDSGNNTGWSFGGTTQPLSPAVFVNDAAFSTHTLTPGAVALTPSLFTNSASFYSAAVVVAGRITPSLFTNSQTFYSPTVIPDQALTPALFTNTQTFYSASTIGSQALLPAKFTNTQTFYTPNMTDHPRLFPAVWTNNNYFVPATVRRVPPSDPVPFKFERRITHSMKLPVRGSFRRIRI